MLALTSKNNPNKAIHSFLHFSTIHLSTIKTGIKGLKEPWSGTNINGFSMFFTIHSSTGDN
jgi:hypothetical protein